MATKIIGQRTAAPQSITIRELPVGARALLVGIDSETGQLTARSLVTGESVLNIERDLLKHLNEYAHATAWLEVLRDYCSARPVAEARARAAGRFITPSPRMDWDMTSIIAAREVNNG
ncbi:hypothetical protein [Variovorax sp. GB1P17]|uniref:hypothetical protein n=1 Tax=Variovorax sp. GB1P17 TaxID=3443740 RepID=UPI003F44F614